MSGLPIFGGWETKTRLAAEEHTSDEAPRLEVSSFVASGGVEVHT